MHGERVVRLAYGKEGIDLKVRPEWNVTVVEPGKVVPLVDSVGALSGALREPIFSRPLKEVVRSGMKVGIIFNDITRPTPNGLIIKTILSELPHVPKESVTLFNSLGTHRPNSEKELRSMLDDYLVENYRIVQNNAFDPDTQEHIGTTLRGNKVWINQEILSCDIRILTGFIEPHFFAGFSGGGKALMPGMASLKTIMKNHDAENIGNRNASWGITIGNPVWEEVREVLGMTGPAFLVNITLDRDKQITGVFAGDPFKAHDLGMDFVRGAAMVPVEKEFDMVVTTNSGYPLDLNLYQTVKGMSAAARVVRQGGVILAVAECWDGIPDHGNFGKLLTEHTNPEEMLQVIHAQGFACLDQWQAQLFAQIRLKAEVHLYSENLSEEALEKVRIRKCHDIAELIEMQRQMYGQDFSICLLPEGPQTIPYLESRIL
jgi:lactate racemase